MSLVIFPEMLGSPRISNDSMILKESQDFSVGGPANASFPHVICYRILVERIRFLQRSQREGG